MRENRVYSWPKIQPRHFCQTAQNAGLQTEDLDNIFSDLVAVTDKAIAEAVKNATEVGMPESTSGPILDGVRNRARELDYWVVHFDVIAAADLHQQQAETLKYLLFTSKFNSKLWTFMSARTIPWQIYRKSGYLCG